MEAIKKTKKTSVSSGKEAAAQKPKSKIALFWEQYPDGIGGEIVNMRAVLR
jgi:hypothetical protein